MPSHVSTEAPLRTATARVFDPTTFQWVFSAAIPPVLRIRAGDTVRTTTVDSLGFDAQCIRRGRPGNPLTGPFYIEGARRGDTLAVTLDSIRPNRDTAYSGARLVRNTVSSSYRRGARYDYKKAEWRLDLQRGVAIPAVSSERLKNFAVPLRPFLGCIGVAPPSSEAFGPTWLGPWGGNLDYNRLREGATLYLPIFQTGALLSFGDDHAAQGDGEIAGDAIETSMDVIFTVDVVASDAEHKPVGLRARTREERMAFGIADSMIDAFQSATTGLAEWISDDYHLTSNETALVLGTSIRYDIAEIVDPKINIVARIRESTLAALVPNQPHSHDESNAARDDAASETLRSKMRREGD